MAAIAPMAVPHRAMSDIDIRGYKIPKVTLILIIDGNDLHRRTP